MLDSHNTASLKDHSLSEDDDDSLARRRKRIYIFIKFTKMTGSASLNPVRLEIPHPFRRASEENLSVCILTKDPQKQFKALINPLGIQSVSKIIGISKLRAKYKPFEAKRLLCGSFDLFLADSSILPMLPKVLGGKFFDKKKQPVSVNLKQSDPEKLKKELVGAIEATFFFKTGASGTSICVGDCSQSDSELSANIVAVIKQLGKKLSNGLRNIQSISVKTSDSASLPIYVRAAQETENKPKADN